MSANGALLDSCAGLRHYYVKLQQTFLTIQKLQETRVEGVAVTGNTLNI
jgi:hypothetical protein